MTITQNCKLSATKLLESLDVGGRQEDTRSYDYLNKARGLFHKLNPEKRIAIFESKFKEGVNIIIRVE